MKSYLSKRNYQLFLILFSAVILTILAQTVMTPLKNVLNRSKAQSANSFFFSPASITMPPNTTVTAKANVGTNVVSFIGVRLQFDITKVQLTSQPVFPLVASGDLYLAIPHPNYQKINCNPSSGDSTCTNGVLQFAMAVYPQAGNTPQTGTFDLAQLSFTSVSNVSNDSLNIAYVTTQNENEIVDNATGQDLPLSLVALPVTLNPQAATNTPTRTPSPSRTPTPSVSPTLPPGITPSVTPTPSRTPTPSSTPTRTPTPSRTPTLPPGVTASATPTPSRTPSPTRTPTLPPGITASATPTPSRTPSPTRTPTPIPGQPSNTAAPSQTPLPTYTASPLACDANGDKRVDDNDFLIMLSHFLEYNNGGVAVGDCNGNGVVDGVDYVIWMKNAQF